MAQEPAAQHEVDVLERGDIYFVYRPKAETPSVEGFEDVQRFYMVLHPYGKSRYRLIVIGQKQLPELRSGREKNWGFVAKVSRAAGPIRDELTCETYATKTRGQRVRPAGRPAGEGVYAIVWHDNHTHLAYVLELPEQPGPPQEALNIAEEGGYILSVKNPELPSPPGLGMPEERQAAFPKRLQQRFRGRRFVEVDPPDFLNYEGAELLLVGAASDVAEELSVQLEAQRETAATAEIFNDLRLEKSRQTIEPLLRGDWA
jgi:hypothetical protein